MWLGGQALHLMYNFRYYYDIYAYDIYATPQFFVFFFYDGSYRVVNIYGKVRYFIYFGIIILWLERGGEVEGGGEGWGKDEEIGYI